MLSELLGSALPVSDDPRERSRHAFGFVSGWLFSEPMRELLVEFGEHLPPSGSMPSPPPDDDWLHSGEALPAWIPDLLRGTAEDGRLTADQVDVLRRTIAVEQIAAEHFDFRGRGATGYRERHQAVAADFSDDRRERIFRLAAQLGLVNEAAPRYPEYDETLILGGGYSSPQLRAKYASQIGRNYELGRLYFLGSPRFLIAEPPEAPAVEYYARGASDEFDLMIGAAEREFSLISAAPILVCGCVATDVLCEEWREAFGEPGETPLAYTHERVADLRDGGGPRGQVLSAHTSRPPFRPDTSDTFALWARVSEPQLGQRALIVTTQVFVPFQAFDGVRRLYLAHGLDVDAVGFGAGWGDRPLTAEYLLQETLSAMRSARRLLVDAAEVLLDVPVTDPPMEMS
ncbi:hypothetical protein ACFQNE_11530 [Gordonia phosphorivorans]|uniref:SIR2-like domain-containing protein n=1 Tax=Gordonia phosphorivorans TaxID=1056982 RepID=A0ABV6HDP0_9ACTN